MNREQAIKTGSKFYETGKPCINGHIDKRYVKGGQCVICAADHSKDQQRKVRDILSAVRDGRTPDVRKVHRVRIHPDDASQVDAFVTALNLQRGLS